MKLVSSFLGIIPTIAMECQLIKANRLQNRKGLLPGLGLGALVFTIGLPLPENSSAYADSAPGSSAPRFVALSDGWPIKKFVLNNSGSVAFGGGQNPFSVDGLVLVTSDRFVKFAAVGDAVPGLEGKVFVGFLSNSDVPDLLALNDRDEVVFSAAFMDCKDALSNVYDCFGRGSPILYGLFLYSAGKISRITSTGDEAPGTGGRTFSFFRQLWFNNRGTVLFTAWMEWAEPIGLFSYSGGRIEKIALQNDPTPLGGALSLNTHFRTDNSALLFDDDGVITFLGSRGVFHFAQGRFVKIVAPGDPAPVVGKFIELGEGAFNGKGDVAFRARFGSSPSEQGLFLRRRDGSVTQILAHGDPTPLGGAFTLWYEAIGRWGRKQIVSIGLSPKLNDAGSVVFAAPIQGGSAPGALFLYTRDGMKKLVAHGDPAPVETQKSFVFADSLGIPVIFARFTINNLDMVAFASGLSEGLLGLFQFFGGKIRKVAALEDAAPGAEGSTFVKNLSPFSQNGLGDVAFRSGLCCGRFTEGIFLSSLPRPAILNGDFEMLGDGGSPANWQTVWNNSGSGEAFQYDSGGAYAFQGNSVLRLHVGPGGGSTFVLSDPMPALPDTPYLITSRMRYNLASDSDSVYFSVIQFDTAGNVVGFDEVRGVMGENFWSWQPKRLPIRTAPDATSIRIRFGLMSAAESHLDVDAVQ